MVGLTAAIIGSAVIGAGASAIGASKNSKAIRRSQAAQTDANAQSLAAQERARAENTTMQQPFYQTGLAANNRINALLGLGVQQQPQQPMGNVPQVTPMGGQGFGGGAMDRRYNMGEMFMGGGPDEYAFSQQMAQPTQQPQTTQQTNELAGAQQGFSDWRDNTGYKFRFGEGIRAIDAGAPVRNSGATLKARQQYGQDIGSAEFYNYLGALTGQQQVGTGAANALSGVNSTYANNASNIAQNQGQNIANSAVMRANSSNNMINGITSSFNNAVGVYGAMGGFGAKPPVATGRGFGNFPRF